MTVSFDPAGPVVPASGASTPETSVGARGRSIARRAIEEAKQYLGFATYLLVVLGTLILFSTNVYARLDQDVQHYPSHHFYALALINALVLAKIMLLAEAAQVGTWSIGRHLRKGPLAVVILYRALLFAAILIGANVLEVVLVGAWHGKTVSEVLPEIAGGPRGVATFAWVLFMALIPYFTYRELGHVLGEARLRGLLLAGGTPSAASRSEL